MSNATVWKPHVTVAAIVPRDGCFLLVEEYIQGTLLLNQPAGHLEPGESLLEAAYRETLEETAWTIKLTGLVAIYQWSAPNSGEQFLRFTFAAEALDHDPKRKLDAGVARTVWLSRDELEQAAHRTRSPMVLRGVDDYLSGKHLPLNTVQSLLP